MAERRELLWAQFQAAEKTTQVSDVMALHDLAAALESAGFTDLAKACESGAAYLAEAY